MNLSEKTYHHGNLKQALIEAGIEMMNDVGEEGMSLRKIAAKCGVSNAAPYAHFTNLEELIHAMQDYVTEQFVNCLKEAVESSKDPESEDAIVCMGRAYVMFFHKNPQYYKFLYHNAFIKIDLSMESSNNFPPFEMLRDLVLKVNEKQNRIVSKEQQELELLKLWADVQGLASIASMKNIIWNQNWEDTVIKILCFGKGE